MSGKMEEPKKGKGVSGLVFAACLFLGAEDEIRTRDLLLGKEAFYR